VRSPFAAGPIGQLGDRSLRALSSATPSIEQRTSRIQHLATGIHLTPFPIVTLSPSSKPRGFHNMPTTTVSSSPIPPPLLDSPCSPPPCSLPCAPCSLLNNLAPCGETWPLRENTAFSRSGQILKKERAPHSGEVPAGMSTGLFCNQFVIAPHLAAATRCLAAAALVGLPGLRAGCSPAEPAR
jgi:hypothetical protein